MEFAYRHDLAHTIDDVLSRRVPLLLVAHDQGLGVSERVADVGAEVLGWSQSERERQIEHYRDIVTHTRRFREQS